MNGTAMMGNAPSFAVNTGSVQSAPADVLICRVTIENGNLRSMVWRMNTGMR